MKASDNELFLGVSRLICGEIRDNMTQAKWTMAAHNHRSRRLYERMGFAVEGRRRQCLLVDSRPVDELYMAKLLPCPAD